jgi:hypothetical protein
MCQPLAFMDLWGRISMTSRVMAMASTPSLKASSRVLVTVLAAVQRPCGGT